MSDALKRNSKRRRGSSAKQSKRKRRSRAKRNANTIKFAMPMITLEEASAPEDADWDREWISATSTRNFALKDPLPDWLKCHYTSLIDQKYTRDVLSAMRGRKNSNNFIEYIMEQGCIFEQHVTRMLCEEFGSDLIINIGGELNARSKEKVQETLDAMNHGVPIIQSGLLHNPENKTYGIPDLMIRSDWINEIVSINPLTKNQTKVPAPRLRDVHNPTNPPQYHYCIVDIKFSTLNLRSDGIHLLNCGSFPAFKTQLYIYNEALSRIQGYNSHRAYVLGRKWCFTIKGERYKGTSCFDRLGTIDYSKVDLDYVNKAKDALKWLKECRSDVAKNWNILNVPLTRKELYPNMCNSKDYPWRSVKEKIAESIKELTSVWMIGVKNREVAHSKGVYQWTDRNCNVDALGINGNFTRGIVSKILEINQPHSQRLLKVKPRIIDSNYMDWKNKKELEFYVDFETINNVMTNFESLPHTLSTNMIFMIGVGFIEPSSGEWIYKDFTVDSIIMEEEERICHEFSSYIRSEADFYEVESPSCVHWAHAEQIFWKDAVDRHTSHSDVDANELWGVEWEWFDLLKLFKEEPIVIRDCLKFDLKTVATALKKHGYISTGWDKNSSCLDGQGAMVGAWRAHKEALDRGISMKETPQIREITKYNKVDVRVLYEIITYLRINHTEYSRELEKLLELDMD